MVMSLRLTQTSGMDAETKAEIESLAIGVAEAQRMAGDADNRAANAQQMVRNRDPRLTTVEGRQEVLAEQQQALAMLAADYEQALAASIGDRESLHERDAELTEQIGTLARTLDELVRQPGPPGSNGLSAYELARQQGYGGTLTQWLASLKGADGQSVKGDAGPSGTASLAIGARPVGLLALGGQVDVTVPLSRTMPSTTYTVHAAHSAVVSLSDVTLTVKTRTATSVVVTVRASGLALAAGTLIVTAVGA